MSRIRPALAVLLAAVASPAAAQVRQPTTSPGVSEQTRPEYREVVSKVVNRPTVTAKYAEPPLVADPAVYQWMTAHPDRVSLAWQRMQIPCVEIRDLGNGRFAWADENGSELVWHAVGNLADGVIWYATGKVKASPLLPMVPVKAVAVLKHPAVPTGKGVELRPELQVFVQTDSRAANAILRMLGPAAPKAAEQGAEQLLYFFSGVATHLAKHPDRVQELLGPKK